MEPYKQRIKAYLESAEIPQSVESIREAAGISNWNTALKHCLELLIQGEIRGQKTSKSWIFWLEREHAEDGGHPH
ncbi:MAG: hypothetical protein QW782_07410 [Candidatus Bathyarchaeia archaeon]